MSDLGLVRSVLRVPARIFQDVTEDDSGHVSAVVSHTDEGFEDFVLVGEILHVVHHLAFRQSSVEFRKFHRREADGFGDGGADQGFHVGKPAGFRHLDLFLRGGGVVAALERITGLERIDRDFTPLDGGGGITGKEIGRGRWRGG